MQGLAMVADKLAFRFRARPDGPGPRAQRLLQLPPAPEWPSLRAAGGRSPPMRNLHGRVPAQPTTICLVAALIAMWLLGACTPTHLVVTDASPLAGFRTVYV